MSQPDSLAPCANAVEHGTRRGVAPRGAAFLPTGRSCKPWPPATWSAASEAHPVREAHLYCCSLRNFHSVVAVMTQGAFCDAIPNDGSSALCVLAHAAFRTLWRKSGKPLRPYMERLNWESLQPSNQLHKPPQILQPLIQRLPIRIHAQGCHPG